MTHDSASIRDADGCEYLRTRKWTTEHSSQRAVQRDDEARGAKERERGGEPTDGARGGGEKSVEQEERREGGREGEGGRAVGRRESEKESEEARKRKRKSPEGRKEGGGTGFGKRQRNNKGSISA